jgi:hypothetical protein
VKLDQRGNALGCEARRRSDGNTKKKQRPLFLEEGPSVAIASPISAIDRVGEVWWRRARSRMQQGG